MDNEEFVYGSANRMLRKAMREYGIQFSGHGSQFDDQFGDIGGAIVTGLTAIGSWMAENPDKVAEIGAAGAKAYNSSKRLNLRVVRSRRKAKKAKKASVKYDEALVAQISEYIGQYTTMLGEMKRQLTENGIIDPNAQLEVVRNAFAAELYDSPPSDRVKKNVLKMLIYRMDRNLKRAYDAKSQVRVS